MIFLFVAYAAGVMLGWPRLVRTAAWEDANTYQEKLEISDKVYGLMAGTLFSLGWPFIVIGMGIRQVLSIDTRFWDEPKPLQSPVASVKQRRTDKAEAKAQRQKTELAERRLFINKEEQANGFPLTVWEDS